jgi:hypothetical protein
MYALIAVVCVAARASSRRVVRGRRNPHSFFTRAEQLESWRGLT